MSIKVAPGEAADDWSAATREALATEIGAAAADALLARILPVIPAGYDELNWPNSAAIDLPIVDRLALEHTADESAVATA